MIRTVKYPDLFLYGMPDSLKTLENKLITAKTYRWFEPYRQSNCNGNFIVFTYAGTKDGFNDSFRLWLKLDYKQYCFKVVNIMHSWSSYISEYEYDTYLKLFESNYLNGVEDYDIIKKYQNET